MTEKRVLELDLDVAQGLREVGAQLARGQAGLFVGRGPGGFALVAGAVGRGSVEQGYGHMVAISLNERGLRALADRCLSLLGDKPSTPPLPDGLVVS